MKQLLLACLCVLAMPALARAASADSTAAASAQANSLRPGADALQFLVTGNLDGGGIFYKHHLKANHAIRLGLEFSGYDRSLDVTSDTTSAAESGTVDGNSINTHIEVVVQRYANPLAATNVFYGIGPFVDISHAHQEVRNPTGNALLEGDHDSLGIGAVFLLGGEWFASRTLSLDIEYTIRVGYSSDTTEDRRTYGSGSVFHEKREETGWFFNAGNAVRFGLGMYF